MPPDNNRRCGASVRTTAVAGVASAGRTSTARYRSRDGIDATESAGSSVSTGFLRITGCLRTGACFVTIAAGADSTTGIRGLNSGATDGTTGAGTLLRIAGFSMTVDSAAGIGEFSLGATVVMMGAGTLLRTRGCSMTGGSGAGIGEFSVVATLPRTGGALRILPRTMATPFGPVTTAGMAVSPTSRLTRYCCRSLSDSSGSADDASATGVWGTTSYFGVIRF